MTVGELQVTLNQKMIEASAQDGSLKVRVQHIWIVFFLSALLLADVAQGADCKAIQEPAARLACFDEAAKAQPTKKLTAAKKETKPASDDPNAKACTLKAAETLPEIPGLAIKTSRTSTQPVPPNWSSPVPPILVDVDIVAAGQVETYSYLCVTGPAGTVVQRVVK